jgi:AraC-like DNA-binding protein
VSPPVHHVRLLRGALPGVHAEVLHSARSFGRHWHDGHGFGLMDQGGHRSASGRGPVEALAGHIVTSNPGEVHDGLPLGRCARRWRMIHVAPQAMAQLVDAPQREFSRPVFDDPRLRAAIEQVFACWDETTSADRIASARWEEALTQACGLLLQHTEAGGRRQAPAALRQVRECLLNRMGAPPDLAELAQLAGLSRFQLVRQFARWHGLPPFAWLQQQRLRLSRRLIASGTPLAEAAIACGFADQSHLHRQFTRSHGFTPGQWQRMHRGPLQ